MSGTVGDRPTKAYISLGINIAMNIILLIFAHYYKLSIVKYNNLLDVTPADFTLMARNLPLTEDETEVLKYFN